MGLGAQHHSSTPRSPFGFAWALQHHPRALCWQDEDASNGLSSFPSPSLVAMPARRATRERGGLKCLQETVRAVLLGGGAQRRLLPAVHVAGSAGLPPALPLPRSKRETSLGLHPWGTAGEKGEKCWGSLLLPPPDPLEAAGGCQPAPVVLWWWSWLCPDFSPGGPCPPAHPKPCSRGAGRSLVPSLAHPAARRGFLARRAQQTKRAQLCSGQWLPRHRGTLAGS